MYLQAFLLLAAALLVFLLSTRQFSLWLRLAIWAVGVGFLVGAICGVNAGDAVRIPRVLEDAGQHVATLGQSILYQAVFENWRSVTGAAPSMFLITTAFAVLLALVALLAMTPGEALERLVRPLNIALIGAIFGGFAALALVASGLAGYQKNRVYIGEVAQDNVLDGDTIRMGDVSLRLYGIDAPEFHEDATNDGAWRQVCRRGPEVLQCGKDARMHLQQLVAGAIVVCRPPSSRDANQPPKETMGRPIVECTARSARGKIVQINLQMLIDGFATRFENSAGVLRSSYPANEFKQGCTLKPSAWRNDEEARAKFLSGDLLVLGQNNQLGECLTPMSQ